MLTVVLQKKKSWLAKSDWNSNRKQEGEIGMEQLGELNK